MRKRVPTALLIALALAVLIALPAEASTVTASGPVAAGNAVTVTCPEGEQFVSGSALFYRQQGAKRPLSTVALTPDSNGISGFATAPKCAHYWTGTAICELAPVIQTVTAQGAAITGNPVIANCPPETTPYLVSVSEVSVTHPGTGEYQPQTYTTTATGVEFVPTLDGIFTVTLNCSSAPPTTGA